MTNSLQVAQSGAAAERTGALLHTLEIPFERIPMGAGSLPDPDEQTAWAASGAMMLCGRADEPPLESPAPIATAMSGAARALELLARALPGSRVSAIDGPALLGERAALAEPEPASRNGSVAVGGSCRMLACRDGWIALNLARDEDRELMPAWLEAPVDGEQWEQIAEVIAKRGSAELHERAAWMGLAAAAVPSAGVRPPGTSWLNVNHCGETRPPSLGEQTPRVLDLSALWAGPLCGQLLAQAGARVVKLESLERPDGARLGPAAFFDLMNGDKQSVAIEISRSRGRAQLDALLDAADIVIESSRPRALEQLGIVAKTRVASRPGQTWVSITGYGRRGDDAQRVAFGDDAAAAAGLVARSPDAAPLFCGDAIADPITGLHAAVASLASWRLGGGRLLDVSLHAVAAHVAALPDAAEAADRDRRVEVRPPRARKVSRQAAPLGADNPRVFAELGIPC